MEHQRAAGGGLQVSLLKRTLSYSSIGEACTITAHSNVFLLLPNPVLPRNLPALEKSTHTEKLSQIFYFHHRPAVTES